MTDKAPPKPKEGAPCNGCGFCCAAEVCPIGVRVFGTDVAPCPGMTFRDGRFLCGVVLVENIIGGTEIANALGVGRGCDSEDFDLEDIGTSDLPDQASP